MLSSRAPLAGLMLGFVLGGLGCLRPASNGASYAGPNPGQWQPNIGPQPAGVYPQNQQGYAPQPAQQAPWGFPSPGAPPQAAPGQGPGWGAPQAQPQAQAQPQQGLFWPFPIALPQPPPYRPVDVAALRSLVGKVPCAPREMAPGEWVVFDCALFTPVTRAVGLTFADADRYNETRMGLVGGTSPNAPLPASVDHRNDGSEGPVKNQRSVGACTAFSLSTAMDHAIRKLARQDVMSPLHVWSKYATPQMGAAGDGTVEKTITLENVWPYDPVEACKLSKNPLDHCGVAYHVTPGTGSLDPQVRADEARADAAGRYKLAAVERLDNPPNPNQIAAVLAGGDDVWTSFNINTDAWEYQALHGGVIPDYTTSESTGHAVVLAGYRTVNGKRQFLVHNSWGDRWGDHGYGWISEDMVRTQMRGAYKVRVVDAAMPKLPIPGGGGGKTAPNACSSGQVPDAVTGRCAARCSSGSPPAAGVCLPTIPGLPHMGPTQSQGTQQQTKNPCSSGQAPDLMTGACLPLCATGTPTIGGMCLPVPQHK
ncbi:MAG TPA: C1 family peptidase [Minicystis sp.]|nr:C1 family peptidase [Minicystis sp.]